MQITLYKSHCRVGPILIQIYYLLTSGKGNHHMFIYSIAIFFVSYEHSCHVPFKRRATGSSSRKKKVHTSSQDVSERLYNVEKDRLALEEERFKVEKERLQLERERLEIDKSN
ncbi:myb/SANT-like DNA-binding domain-containing protein 4 [Lingula anatina]|uniref:Myb/SANT-like DNA-binding domain-containing protein 4 n=1 Tax=Lingula anatina TaxID=7574 RepID=A0A1S3H5I3_LINAN|nr:myb/SANT-like DNA-binding domain-containing protein 4 [Lingula anatina]|eukprot:XP_013381227.1 myb/SANT-like DNA-binding domain-containing protein 4 [Lingula anatina]